MHLITPMSEEKNSKQKIFESLQKEVMSQEYKVTRVIIKLLF